MKGFDLGWRNREAEGLRLVVVTFVEPDFYLDLSLSCLILSLILHIGTNRHIL